MENSYLVTARFSNNQAAQQAMKIFQEMTASQVVIDSYKAANHDGIKTYFCIVAKYDSLPDSIAVAELLVDKIKHFTTLIDVRADGWQKWPKA